MVNILFIIFLLENVAFDLIVCFKKGYFNLRKSVFIGIILVSIESLQVVIPMTKELILDSNVFFGIFEFVVLYLFSVKGNNKQGMMGKITVVLLASFSVNLIYDLVTYVIARYTLSMVISVIVETILYLIIGTVLVHSNYDKYFDKKNGETLSYTLVYILVSLIIINNIDVFTRGKGSLITVILLAIQGIFAVVIQLNFRQKYDADLKEQENKVLRFYTKQLEENQRALRKFKHDYQNILVSIEGAINDKDLLAEVNRYSAARLDDPKLWRFNNLDNVGDLELKSLLLTKVNTIAHEKLKANFECVDKFAEIRGISKFDLIRIIGIAYDNAIEASKKFGAKAEIRAAIYQDEEGFSFEIRNRYADEVDLTQVTHSGYTTKAGHHGLGLANVKEICDGYSNVLFDTETGEGWFNFIVQVVV